MPDARHALATARHGPRAGIAGWLLPALVLVHQAAAGPALTAAVPDPVEPTLADACAVLAVLDFGTDVAAGAKLAAGLLPAAGDLPERCRVTGTAASGSGFEAWLPMEDWNRKLLVTGCPDRCGSIQAGQMEDAAARGYVTATTDGSNAIHATVALARALAEAFYGGEPLHAYFRGCSIGGHQALVAASRHADDFDGIIAGAPLEPDRDPASETGAATGAAAAGPDADLTAFAARDGRLILYQGAADEIVPPARTLAYWKETARASGGAAELARFARLFMLPDVQHCGGGPGAGDVDYLSAIERWVETDEAPEMLIATRSTDSLPVTRHQRRFPVTGAVLLRRPLFPYPAEARYSGQGDVLDPLSYQRVVPASTTLPAAAP